MFKKYQLTEQERGFWTQHESLENVFLKSIIPRMKAPYWIFYSETYSIKNIGKRATEEDEVCLFLFYPPKLGLCFVFRREKNRTFPIRTLSSA